MVNLIDVTRPVIDYTSQEFLSLVEDSRQLVTDRFPQITDFNTAEITEMIIELFAAVGDRLFFMQNKQALETNIITAKRRRNVLYHARGISYTASSQKAATGEIQATINGDPVTANVIIPKETIISTKETQDPQEFRTTQDIIITPGNLSNVGTIKNSSIHEEEFESNNAANQSFTLSEIPFLDDGTIEVSINSELWLQVDNFLDSLGTSKHFRIELDEDDVGYVIFGDGVNGEIPTGDILINYETGGGLVGNQAPEAITENDDDFESVIGEPVDIEFTNLISTTGGDDRESTDEIRIRAPRALKTLNRTIAFEDYQINVEDGVSGVVRAIGYSSDQIVGIPENTIYEYIVPDGGGTASAGLIQAVETFLTSTAGKPMPTTTDLIVFTALYKVITLVGKIYISKDVDFTETKQNIIDKILLYFSYDTFEDSILSKHTIDFGKTVRSSKIFNLITSVTGVDYIDITTFQINGLDCGQDVELLQYEIPELDSSNFDVIGGLEFLQSED